MENQENKLIEVTEVKETENKVSFKEKAGGFFRKHGKKVAAVAAMGACFVVGTLVGTKRADGDDSDYGTNVIDLYPEDSDNDSQNVM